MSTSAQSGRTWPLVGRTAELDDLDAMLASAAGGEPGTVLVEGEAGIGRTGLVEALTASADLLGLDLRSARATRDRDAPFALLVDALLTHQRGATRGPVETELRDLLDALRADGHADGRSDRKAHGMTQSRADARTDASTDGRTDGRTEGTTDATTDGRNDATTNGRTDGRAVTGAGASAEQRRGRAAELFAALLRRRGDVSPWVLVLEDVHDADAESLGVLLDLAHEGDVPHALVVLTLRPVPYRAVLSTVVDAWVRAGARYLELRPLGPLATVELAERLVGGPVGPALRGTLATTGGNPRLVTDVVRTARSAGALEARDGVVDVQGASWLPALDALVRTRLEYLGDDVVDLLGHASVLGTSFVVTDLAALAGSPVPDCWRTLRLALAAGVVHARADRLVFRHDLVRGALYSGIDERRRRSMHARAAWALQEAGAPTQIVAGHLDRAR